MVPHVLPTEDVPVHAGERRRFEVPSALRAGIGRESARCSGLRAVSMGRICPEWTSRWGGPRGRNSGLGEGCVDLGVGGELAAGLDRDDGAKDGLQDLGAVEIEVQIGPQAGQPSDAGHVGDDVFVAEGTPVRQAPVVQMAANDLGQGISAPWRRA